MGISTESAIAPAIRQTIVPIFILPKKRRASAGSFWKMNKRLKRPRDPVQLGKLIGDILTGQVEDRQPEPERKPLDPAHEFARKGGLKGGKARATVLSSDQRKAIAKKAAKARWSGKSKAPV